MKLVKAIINPYKLNDVRDALSDLGSYGLTIDRCTATYVLSIDRCTATYV